MRLNNEEFSYKLWDVAKKKIIISRDVLFHENETLSSSTTANILVVVNGGIDLTPDSLIESVDLTHMKKRCWNNKRLMMTLLLKVLIKASNNPMVNVLNYKKIHKKMDTENQLEKLYYQPCILVTGMFLLLMKMNLKILRKC